MSTAKIGDVIETVTPMNCDSLTYSAGERLRVTLTNAKCVEVANKLLNEGTWRLSTMPHYRSNRGEAARAVGSSDVGSGGCRRRRSKRRRIQED